MTASASAVELKVSLQIPNSYIEQDLAKLLRIVQIFLLIVALATIVWITVCALAAARPLNRITNAMYDSKHLPNEPGGKGSISDLADWIKRLDSNLTNYEDIIAAQQENLRMHTLEKALYRGLYNQESREAFRAAFPRFPKRWQMAFIQYGPEETGMDDSRLTLLFTECMQQQLPGVILLPTGSDTLLVILPKEEDWDPVPELDKLRAAMKARYGLLFSYTLGETHEGPAALAGAYQQMEYERSTMLTASSAPHREKPPLSLQQLQTMYMALSCGDEKASLGLLENAAASLDIQQDFFLSKHTYQMIANMLVMIKLESACDLNDIPIPPFSRGEIGRLYKEELPRCFSCIAGRIARQRKALTQDLDQSILNFINENLGSPLLCISMVTDKFQISAPTLQKRLHEATAQTFSAYVEDARMNKARMELRETGRTVQEISEDCGYTTPNSFYKAYKRRFREAPLSLRRDGKNKT